MRLLRKSARPKPPRVTGRRIVATTILDRHLELQATHVIGSATKRARASSAVSIPYDDLDATLGQARLTCIEPESVNE